ncbi:Cytochrome P450 monooxygenase vrtE [Paramyrothecium foliicola]|nr:Cytochrome P450 monooxygenase vrtE [Paramyrothecium foliicola]
MSLFGIFHVGILLLCISSFLVIIVVKVAQRLRVAAKSPLNRYPGPLLAKITDFWRLWLVYHGNYAPDIKRLHEKYGPIVRLGPNLLDLDWPALSKTIYSTDGRWIKSDFYKNNSIVSNGKITYHMFSETNNVEHARLKRPVVRHYSVPRALAMEGHMDNVLVDFCEHLRLRFVERNKDCNLGDWVSYFAWDLLSTVTFSKKFGYMGAGKDFDGTMAIADQSIDYLGLCGQMPWLDHWLDKNPVYRLGPPNLSTVTGIAVEALTARLKGVDENFHPEDPDFLQHFIDSMTAHPEVVNKETIIGYLLLNLIAGADTTAITIRALLYYTLKDRKVWIKLENEIRNKSPPGKPVSYAIAKSLPYLDATVRETLRYHPAVSMIMERVVPEDGLALPDGFVVPAGTLVGMNPYVVGRNEEVFGPDADKFRPERWLQRKEESSDEYAERLQVWNTANLTFGAGSRICLGRHFSQVEMFKVVATLIATFDIQPADTGPSWSTTSRWFYRNKGVVCKLTARK